MSAVVTWEEVFLYDSPAASRAAPAPVAPPVATKQERPEEPAPTASKVMPMIVSPVTLMAPGLAMLGEAAVNAKKPTTVELPCFIC